MNIYTIFHVDFIISVILIFFFFFVNISVRWWRSKNSSELVHRKPWLHCISWEFINNPDHRVCQTNIFITSSQRGQDWHQKWSLSSLDRGGGCVQTQCYATSDERQKEKKKEKTISKPRWTWTFLTIICGPVYCKQQETGRDASLTAALESAWDRSRTAMIKASSNTSGPLPSTDWQLRCAWALSGQHSGLKCSHLIFHKLTVRIVKCENQRQVGQWLVRAWAVCSSFHCSAALQQLQSLHFASAVEWLSVKVRQIGGQTPPIRLSSFRKKWHFQRKGLWMQRIQAETPPKKTTKKHFQRYVGPDLSNNIIGFW